ncbi:MAG: hypothetical protein K1X83_08040 [Oligoflexia bacterium]|nr:hypothetical protein [Oligoflexia bacterium]
MAKYGRVLIILWSLLLASGSDVAAAPRRERAISRSIACPKIIADPASASYRPQRTGRRSSGNYKCYRKASDARRDGFLSQFGAAISSQDYTGWYRITLNLVKDTCTGDGPGSGPVLFLQIRQTEAGVFGEFCPAIGSYSGVRSGSGFVISGEGQLSENPAQSMCDDGKVEEHQYIEMTRVVDPLAAFNVSFKWLHSCSSQSSGDKSCIKEYSGIAFHETHILWPPVSENRHELPVGCGMALQNCADCHPELAARQ